MVSFVKNSEDVVSHHAGQASLLLSSLPASLPSTVFCVVLFWLWNVPHCSFVLYTLDDRDFDGLTGHNVCGLSRACAYVFCHFYRAILIVDILF